MASFTVPPSSIRGRPDTLSNKESSCPFRTDAPVAVAEPMLDALSDADFSKRKGGSGMNGRYRWIRAALALLASLVCVASCSNPVAERQRNEDLLGGCPTNGAQVAVEIDIDTSNSSTNRQWTGDIERAVEDGIRRTAVCGGHIRVSVFGGSEADTHPLLDVHLETTGATQNAKLMQVPGLIEDAMETVHGSYQATVDAVKSRTTDVLAQFGRAKELVDQLDAGSPPGSPPHQLDLRVLTDGVQSEGITLNSGDLDAETAIDLADRAVVPALPGAHIIIAGLGHTTGAPPPSEYVDALQAFYTRLCDARLQASRCQAVTDLVTLGS